MLHIRKSSTDISSSVVFCWVGFLRNKGEVAGVILLLCVIHFLVVTVKMVKIGVAYTFTEVIAIRKIKTGVSLFGALCT